MIQQPVALLAFMFLVVAFSRWLEDRVSLIKKLSSAVVCTLLGIVLGNTGVMPQSGVIHTAMSDYSVPYSIVLIVLSSRLRDFRSAGGALLACFGFACLGTVIGSALASAIFAQYLGPETWKLSGMFTGGFIGGGINFVAVGRELGVTPSLFSAALVVDNLSTVPYILAQMGLAGLLARAFHRRKGVAEPLVDDTAAADSFRSWTVAEVSITDLAVLGALPLLFVWAAQQIGAIWPSVPQVLWLTTLTVLAAQLPVMERLKGAPVVAYFALHLFFLSIGSSSRIADVLTAGPLLFVYMMLIIAIHVVVAYGLAWGFGLGLANISIASQAAIGGPGSALALAMGMRWPSLVPPGIIVGILGYAVGNYLGFFCSYLVHTWL